MRCKYVVDIDEQGKPRLSAQFTTLASARTWLEIGTSKRPAPCQWAIIRCYPDLQGDTRYNWPRKSYALRPDKLMRRWHVVASTDGYLPF